MVDDFRIGEQGPERLTTDGVTEPADTEDDTSSGADPDPTSTDYVEETPPATTLVPNEPPPNTEPTESTVSTGPAPPSPVVSGTNSTVDPVPSSGGDEPLPEQDAGTATETEAPTPTDSPVVDSGATEDTSSTAEVDAAAEAGAPPECESGWTYDSRQDWCSSDCAADEIQGPNGRCYWFGTQAVAFSTARTTCTNRGTGWSAISIRSEEEAAFIEAELVADTWIGATDQQVPNTWRWIDDNTTFWQGDETGMAVGGAYTDWGSVEPSAANDEACARFHSGSGNWYWSDTSCTELFRTACQGPTPVEPTYEWGNGSGSGSGPGSGSGSGSAGGGFGGN